MNSSLNPLFSPNPFTLDKTLTIRELSLAGYFKPEDVQALSYVVEHWDELLNIGKFLIQLEQAGIMLPTNIALSYAQALEACRNLNLIKLE